MTTAQKVAFAWAVQTYGPKARARRYQALRFLEEAMELAQALGLTYDDMDYVANYVNARRIGSANVEIGDVRLSLDILAESIGLSSEQCYEDCLTRIAALDSAQTRERDEGKIAAGLI